MKTYKDFEKVYIGSSDIARLVVAGANKEPMILRFGEDSAYSAYFVSSPADIGEHYSKVYECDVWLKIYDDRELAAEIAAEHIEIYRAGQMGCIIYALGGKRR